MYNILAISPVSIAGALIIRGLTKGFQQLGCNTLVFDLRELDYELVNCFKPDFVLGYDYVHFVNQSAERIIKDLNIPVIHYFADDPNDNFAHSGDFSLPERLSKSEGIVFCWDKQHISSFTNECYYLPLGVDPDLYAIDKTDRGEQPEILFTGRPLTERRLLILSEIVKNFPGKLGIYSYKKHFETSITEMQRMNLLNNQDLENYKNCYRGFLETEKELAQVYADSKIVLNITMDQGLSSMNYRVLEVLASEGFLLTDYKQDAADYFTADKDLVFYQNKAELIDKMRFYLNNDAQRKSIAQSGKINVISNHTFKQRAEEIIKKLK